MRKEVTTYSGSIMNLCKQNVIRIVAGGTSPGDDVAQLVRATWRDTRTAYQKKGLLQFEFQQFLFACQARILLKLNRPAEVAILYPAEVAILYHKHNP